MHGIAEKWFDERFIPSLYKNVGEKNEKWLTAKQTNICLEYMNVFTVTDEFGFKHKIASYEWNERTVRLFLSKKNGCGKILFSAEHLPLFDESGKDIDSVPKIIRYIFQCKTKKDLAILTNWSDKKIIDITKECTEIQDLYFSAYRKAVEFQNELLRGLDTSVLTCAILEEKFEKILKRNRRNEKLISYIKNRMKEYQEEEKCTERQR